MPSFSHPKTDIPILLLEGIHPSASKQFKQAGYTNIIEHKKALSDSALVAALAEAKIVGIRSRSQLTDSVLQQAKHLLAIGCFCIGTNQVDTTAAAKLGIPVFNAPFANTRSVAEMVLAEMILLLRQIPAKNCAARQGQWQKSALSSFETRGKTLGIVGYGHIGSQLSVLAEGLGLQVIYYDIEPKLPLGNAKPAESLEQLLQQADVVSLHVPSTPQTKNLLNHQKLQLMKPQAVLINAARGDVVDIAALADLLQQNKLLGAAIDVFPKEPSSNNEPFTSPLQQCDNVILTPHIGGSTEEAQDNIGRDVADKLIRYSDNGSTVQAVNLPEVNLPEHTNRARLLHIHKNEPGVMQQINQVFSTAKVNIAAQYLQTSSTVGYVVIDIESDNSKMLMTQLKAIPHTLKTRVLY